MGLLALGVGGGASRRGGGFGLGAIGGGGLLLRGFTRHLGLLALGVGGGASRRGGGFGLGAVGGGGLLLRGFTGHLGLLALRIGGGASRCGGGFGLARSAACCFAASPATLACWRWASAAARVERRRLAWRGRRGGLLCRRRTGDPRLLALGVGGSLLLRGGSAGLILRRSGCGGVDACRLVGGLRRCLPLRRVGRRAVGASLGIGDARVERLPAAARIGRGRRRAIPVEPVLPRGAAIILPAEAIPARVAVAVVAAARQRHRGGADADPDGSGIGGPAVALVVPVAALVGPVLVVPRLPLGVAGAGVVPRALAVGEGGAARLPVGGIGRLPPVVVRRAVQRAGPVEIGGRLRRALFGIKVGSGTPSGP